MPWAGVHAGLASRSWAMRTGCYDRVAIQGTGPRLRSAWRSVRGEARDEEHGAQVLLEPDMPVIACSVRERARTTRLQRARFVDDYRDACNASSALELRWFTAAACRCRPRTGWPTSPLMA